MEALLQASHQLVESRKWEKQRLGEILGKWVGCLLLRRSFLSGLKMRYEMLSAEKYYPLPPLEASQEIYTLVSISAMLYGRIGREFAEVVLCIDASNKGGRVVHALAF